MSLSLSLPLFLCLYFSLYFVWSVQGLPDAGLRQRLATFPMCALNRGGSQPKHIFEKRGSQPAIFFGKISSTHQIKKHISILWPNHLICGVEGRKVDLWEIMIQKNTENTWANKTVKSCTLGPTSLKFSCFSGCSIIIIVIKANFQKFVLVPEIYQHHCHNHKS